MKRGAGAGAATAVSPGMTRPPQEGTPKAMITLNDAEKQFLLTLYDRLDGSMSGQVSMYDVGAAMGREKPESLRIAESLMGMDAVAVRTLSGAVGLTETGITAARALGAGGGDATPRLGEGPIVDDAGKAVVEVLVTAVKADAGGMGLDFDALAELVADLRTIDAQLASPRPKTAVLRAAFTSLKKTLAAANRKDDAARIEKFIKI